MDETIEELYYLLLEDNYEVFMVTETPDGFEIALRKTYCESEVIPSFNEFVNIKLWKK